MPRYICLLLTLMLCCPFLRAADAYSPGVLRALAQLDSVLAHREIYMHQHLSKLHSLEKETKKPGFTAAERLRAYDRLYDLLSTYNADSALVCTGEGLALARLAGNEGTVATWQIRRSFVLAVTGVFQESERVLRSVPVATLSREGQLDYYTQAAYLYSHMALYLGERSPLRQRYFAMERACNDSLARLSRPGDVLYLWHQAWHYQDNPARRARLIVSLKERLKSSHYDNRTDAMLAYALARLSRKAGNDDDYLTYLALSGIADIRSANRDIASLEELGKELFHRGDLDRAYAYINFCGQNAIYYKNRVRTVSLADVQDAIWQAYQQRAQSQAQSLRLYTVLITVLSVVLIIALLFIRRQMKRLSASLVKLREANEQQASQRRQLETAHHIQEEANAQLTELNRKLKETAANLQESDYIKEEYISHIFIFCSNYISKLDNLRKTINRKATAGQYVDIKRLTSSESMVQDELREFYHKFDAIFLHIYPDFIDEFNALLRPEARFALKKSETLNTQLRIYALVRLGINDSVKIAEFLHCSPQTVYNYRLKTRNSAVIPKETFARTVSRLGKVQL